MKNFVQVGRIVALACSDPQSPVSGDPVRFGSLTGVAVADEAGSQTTVYTGSAIFYLPVRAVDAAGDSPVAPGDALFYVDADTPRLSKKSTGYFFGFALEAIPSGQTATIKVLHCQSPGSGTLGDGTVGTAQLANAAVTAAKMADTQDWSSKTLTLPPVLVCGTAGMVYPIVSPKGNVVAHDQNDDLSADDFGKIHTNTESSDTITLTLPAASTVAGKALKVQVTAAYAVRLAPQSTEKIYLGGSGVAGKYVEIDGTVGNYLDLYCDGTDYLIVGYSGVVTQQSES